MALVWNGRDFCRDGGSDTASDEEGAGPTPVANARRTETPMGRVAYWRSADRDTLEAAVVLVVFQRAARYFGAYRYRFVT